MIIVQNPTSAEQLPIGSIVIWSGLVATIPSGWQKCDGTNGTPNTAGKFVRCATDDSNLYGTGGATTHLHTAGAAASGNSHDHTYSFNTGGPGTTTGGVGSIGLVSLGSHTHSAAASVGSTSHSHSSGGNTGSATNIPPSKKYYFIMRLT